MEDSQLIATEKRCAVVTGANKGIGLEICRQLASKGITVVLTARDDKKGFAAIKNLRIDGLSNVTFHQLDVTDSTGIASLAKFIQTRFGKLDILVNNAGDSGLIVDAEAFRNFKLGGGLVTDENAQVVNEILKQTYERAEECVKTNFYGTKRVTEALLPLQLSGSARIVNLSSIHGQLKFVYNERVKEELQDINSLTEEKVDEILRQFLDDFKDGKLGDNGWPCTISAYKVSKATINAYARLVVKKCPAGILVNCVHPGYVKTDMTSDIGTLTPEEGARAPVMLALLPDGGPSGLYYDETKPSTF